MKNLLFALIVLLLTSGCALTIRPNPSDPDASVNAADHSITITRPQLKLSVRVQDVAVGGYSTEKPIASFYLDAYNRGGRLLSIPLTSIELRDDQGRTYPSLQPEFVTALLDPAPDYLIPFPFVGYLDVSGLESYRASSAMASAEPYVGQAFPADPLPKTFDGSALTTGSRQSGVVFFEVDLHQMKSVQLRVHLPGVSQPFEFPFVIEK